MVGEVMLEKDFDDIEIIDIDDEIEIIDVIEESPMFETGAFSDDDLLNEVDVLSSNAIEKNDFSKEEKGFSHVLLYSFLGGFTGGILLTILLHLVGVL